MRKFIIASLCTMVLALLVTGCGAPGKSTGNSATTITIWDQYAPNQPPGKTFDTLVQQFNSSQSKIHVTAQYVTTQDDMLSKVMTALVGNQEPDMIVGGSPTWGPGLLASGKVVALNSYLKASRSLQASDFYPGMLAISSYGGKVLSIPGDGGDYGISYNKDLFKEAGLNPDNPPATWNALIKDAQQIKQKTGKWGFYVPIGNTEWTVYTFEGMLWADGGTFIDTSGPKAKVEFNSPQGDEALQTWVDMIHRYKVAPPVGVPSTENAAQILQQNTIAMTITTPGNAAALNQINFPLGTTKFPQGTAGYATNLGTNASYIFKTGTAKQNASWQFIQWFMQPKNLAQWDIGSGYLPTLMAVTKMPSYENYLQQNPDIQPFVDSLKYAHGRPSLKSYSDISAELGNAIEAALYGNIPVKQALDQAAQKAQAILQQNNE